MSDGPSDSKNDRLTQLIHASGFGGYADSDGAFRIPFLDEHRSWEMLVRSCSGWITFRTPILMLPKSLGRRAAMLDAAMRLNADVAVGKYAVAYESALVLDAEYREDHVDGRVMRNLISMMSRIAADHYPRLARIAMCSEQLDALERAFHDGPEAA